MSSDRSGLREALGEVLAYHHVAEPEPFAHEPSCAHAVRLPASVWQTAVCSCPVAAEPDATVSDPVALTDAEREALLSRAYAYAFPKDDDDPRPEWSALESLVKRIKAEAVEQERAAWDHTSCVEAYSDLVTKIKAARQVLNESADELFRAILDDTKAGP